MYYYLCYFNRNIFQTEKFSYACVITDFYNGYEMFCSLALNKFALINMHFELDKKVGLLYTNGIAFEIRIRVLNLCVDLGNAHNRIIALFKGSCNKKGNFRGQPR